MRPFPRSSVHGTDEPQFHTQMSDVSLPTGVGLPNAAARLARTAVPAERRFEYFEDLFTEYFDDQSPAPK